MLLLKILQCLLLRSHDMFLSLQLAVFLPLPLTAQFSLDLQVNVVPQQLLNTPRSFPTLLHSFCTATTFTAVTT